MTELKWIRCPNPICATPEQEWSENTIRDLGMCYDCFKAKEKAKKENTAMLKTEVRIKRGVKENRDRKDQFGGG